MQCRMNSLNVIDKLLRMQDAATFRGIMPKPFEFKDRRAQFGMELIQTMHASFGTELGSINRVESDYKQDILDDMNAIIVHFSSRLYGKRCGRKKTPQIEQIIKDTAN